MANHPYRSARELTGEELLQLPLPFTAKFMCLTSQTGLPIYYAQVFAGHNPANPFWQSKIRRDIAPTAWPKEAQCVADEAAAKFLARREQAARDWKPRT